MLTPLRYNAAGPIEHRVLFEYKRDGTPVQCQTGSVSKLCEPHIRNQVRVNIDNQARWKGPQQINEYVVELVQTQISERVHFQIRNQSGDRLYWLLLKEFFRAN